MIDELSLGLAPVVVSRLIPTLRSVAQAGTGILLIEQFATVALGLANRAYIMNGGRDRVLRPGEPSCASSPSCCTPPTCSRTVAKPRALRHGSHRARTTCWCSVTTSTRLATSTAARSG